MLSLHLGGFSRQYLHSSFMNQFVQSDKAFIRVVGLLPAVVCLYDYGVGFGSAIAGLLNWLVQQTRDEWKEVIQGEAKSSFGAHSRGCYQFSWAGWRCFLSFAVLVDILAAWARRSAKRQLAQPLGNCVCVESGKPLAASSNIFRGG